MDLNWFARESERPRRWLLKSWRRIQQRSVRVREHGVGPPSANESLDRIICESL